MLAQSQPPQEAQAIEHRPQIVEDVSRGPAGGRAQRFGAGHGHTGCEQRDSRGDARRQRGEAPPAREVGAIFEPVDGQRGERQDSGNERDEAPPQEQAHLQCRHHCRLPLAKRPQQGEDAGHEGDLRSEQERKGRRQAERDRVGAEDVRPAPCGREQEEESGVDDPGGRKGEEASRGRTPRPARSQLVGEALRDDARPPEGLQVRPALAQMVCRLDQDPPPARASYTDGAKLLGEGLEIAVTHVTTASTALVNLRQSRCSLASARRPREVTR
jgi:hypothetical protein